MWTRAALLLVASAALGACVVLPIPQRVVHHPTLVGRLVYADSGQPAAGAVVSIGPPGSGPSTTANERGDFELVTSGWRFPFTSAPRDDDPVAAIAQIWATVGSGPAARSKQVGQLMFYPPTFSDPGSGNATPAELGVVRF
jgi:hypothetical protein